MGLVHVGEYVEAHRSFDRVEVDTLGFVRDGLGQVTMGIQQAKAARMFEQHGFQKGALSGTGLPDDVLVSRGHIPPREPWARRLAVMLTSVARSRI